jgi:hypothetical protein
VVRRLDAARLLHDTNRHDEARTMLAEIYEGSDTAELKEVWSFTKDII